MPTQQQRLLLRKLARDFMAIPLRSHQQGIISLARALAEPEPLACIHPRRDPQPGHTRTVQACKNASSRTIARTNAL